LKIRNINQTEILDLFNSFVEEDDCILKIDNKFFGYDDHPQYPERTYKEIRKAYIFKSVDSVFNLLKWYPHEKYEIIRLNDKGIKKSIKEWRKDCPLKTHRISNNWSQTELAAMLGVATYTVQRWEEGTTSPSEDNIEKLSDIIGNFENKWIKWQKERPIH
jgi:DNA-binding transcriptional regulator YiaG